MIQVCYSPLCIGERPAELNYTVLSKAWHCMFSCRWSTSTWTCWWTEGPQRAIQQSTPSTHSSTPRWWVAGMQACAAGPGEWMSWPWTTYWCLYTWACIGVLRWVHYNQKTMLGFDKSVNVQNSKTTSRARKLFWVLTNLGHCTKKKETQWVDCLCLYVIVKPPKHNNEYKNQNYKTLQITNHWRKTGGGEAKSIVFTCFYGDYYERKPNTVKARVRFTVC